MSDAAEREVKDADNPAWQPIETSPKDGTVVDLWVVSNPGGGKPPYHYRETDAAWRDGRWVRRIRDGDYLGEDDGIEWSVRTHVPPDKWWVWKSEMDRESKVTHWMPLPEPPE